MQKTLAWIAFFVIALMVFIVIYFAKDASKVLPDMPSTPVLNQKPSEGKAWMEFSAPGKFKVMFPSLPTHAWESITDPATKETKKYDIYMDEKGNGTIFMVTTIQFSDAIKSKGDDNILKEMLNDVLNVNPKNHLQNMKDSTFKNKKSIEFSIHNEDIKVEGREFVNDNTLYVLTSIAKGQNFSEEEAKRFFDSFELSPNPNFGIDSVSAAKLIYKNEIAMHKKIFKSIIAIAFALYTVEAAGATAARSSGGSTSTTTTTTTGATGATGTLPPPTTKLRPEESAPKTKARFKAKAEKPLVPVGPLLFMTPGIVGVKNGQWVGSDDLYNVSPDIEVAIEVVIPPGKSIALDQSIIKRKVEQMLYQAGIEPRAFRIGDSPPLPMYHVLILINTINNGYVASCSCRLFEAVTLKRITLQEGITFQAITWERQDLLILPADAMFTQILSSVEDLTKEFLERYKYFQNLEIQIKNQ